ncbi:MAG: MarR family transcriptional regulator [Clostridiales bacterium]|nr:MarR family transcriptional regulator [Clostridiales bacterium]
MPTLMRQINTISRCAGAYRADKLSDSEITPCHHSFILAISHHPGITQEMLSKHIYINKSNVTRTLSYLEEHGYVTRTPNPEDKRQLFVYPTEKMEAILPKIKAIAKSWNEYLTEELSPEELSLFSDVLEKITLKAKSYVNSKEEGQK